MASYRTMAFMALKDVLDRQDVWQEVDELLRDRIMRSLPITEQANKSYIAGIASGVVTAISEELEQFVGQQLEFRMTADTIEQLRSEGALRHDDPSA